MVMKTELSGHTEQQYRGRLHQLSGTIALHLDDGMMKKLRILHHNLKPSAEPCTQQDTDCKHTSQLAVEWIKKTSFELNPIEKMFRLRLKVGPVPGNIHS